MTIRGIIFDLGWTLLEFDGDIAATLVQRAQDLGSFLNAQGFEQDGVTVFADYRREMDALWQAGGLLNYEYPAQLAMLRALRRHLARADAARLARAALAASFDCLIPCWRPYPDTYTVLTALRDAGCRLGCISNTNDDDQVQRMIDDHGLRDWLSPIYTSAGVGLRKPHPGIFRMLLDAWEMQPGEVVMVGDTLNADVLGAHNAGMRAVWIDRGPTNPWSRNQESMGVITPDATIQQLAELPDLVTNSWA